MCFAAHPPPQPPHHRPAVGTHKAWDKTNLFISYRRRRTRFSSLEQSSSPAFARGFVRELSDSNLNQSHLKAGSAAKAAAHLPWANMHEYLLLRHLLQRENEYCTGEKRIGNGIKEWVGLEGVSRGSPSHGRDTLGWPWIFQGWDIHGITPARASVPLQEGIPSQNPT